MSASGRNFQALKRTHNDEGALLHRLAEFVARYGIYLLVGVGLYVGAADIAAEDFKTSLLLNNL